VGDLNIENSFFLTKYLKKLNCDGVETESITLCKRCENRFKRLKNKFLAEIESGTIFL
jgi:hypothetical protein